MSRLRSWKIGASQPHSLLLAADARLRPTDYADDQVWRLSPGTTGAPALALQTVYGGRVGLASLVPLWSHDGRLIYEAQAYAKPPVISAFAPGYLRLQAALTPQIALQAEYWSIDSHTLGGQFTLAHTRSEPATVRLDLFGHVGAQGEEQPLALIPLEQGQYALHLGKVGNINPVLLLENGTTELVGGQAVSPKIGCDLTLNSRKKVAVRWVHAGLPNVTDSVAQAQHWLGQDWKPYFKQIEQAAVYIPEIETGDADLDSTLASAFNDLVLAFLKPTGSLPYASIVAQREPVTGFSRQRDGSDYPRTWSGQTPTLSYLAGLGIASVDAALGQGLVRNFLAIQQDDGAIDARPGLGGQRQGLLCMPILARLAWGLYQYSEDAEFLREVFPGLLHFFEHWLQADVDGDGLPEWQHELQTGYGFWPSFGGVQPWADNTDMHAVESPDLLAYLLSEAISLQAIASTLEDQAREQQLGATIHQLQTALESLWNGERYIYRDRDVHTTSPRQTLLTAGRGDQSHILAIPLDPPARLNLRVQGGVNLTPRFRLEITGLDANGQAVRVNADQNAFIWQQNRGVHTTAAVFSQVDVVRLDGLSRVYTVDITTPDTTRLDLNALLPLWAVLLPEGRSSVLIDLLNAEFIQPNGVTMCAASDPAFDPANAQGSGGIWPFWLTLIGEGLIEAGRFDLAADVLQRLLKVQVSVLKAHQHFSEFYHSDAAAGLGTPGHLGGNVPVYLLLRVLGVRIMSSGKVWTGGAYPWPGPVVVRQHGVEVRRSADGTIVTFPSGHEVQLPATADWQAIIDPNPKRTAPIKAVRPRSTAATDATES